MYTATSMIHVGSSMIYVPGNEIRSSFSTDHPEPALQRLVHASGCLNLPWAEKLTRQSLGCCVRPEQRVDTLCVRAFSVFECVFSIDGVTSLGGTGAFEYPTD